MYSKLQRIQVFWVAAAFAVLFWLAHVVSLPLVVTYDGLGYIDLADVLGSSRFPADWNHARTPFFPLSLKLAFAVFGRQANSAVLVPSLCALIGILLLGASIRRIAHDAPAAVIVVIVSIFPTLVAYEHCVLTETGSFLCISLTVFLLLWNTTRYWLRAALLGMALAAGYYWRQTILVIAPVIALFHFLSALRGLRIHKGPVRRLIAQWPLAAQAAAVVILPILMTRFWEPYLDSAGLRDVSIRQGIIRQALLPPEDPLVGSNRDEYYRDIRESLYHGNFISGMRWDLLVELSPKIWSRPIHQSYPRYFLDLIAHNPGRYLTALGRTMAFYGGVDGVESDNRIFREQALSPGSKISGGPEALRSRVANDFSERTTGSLTLRFLRDLIPIFEPLLIIASVLTVGGLIIGVLLGDSRLLVFSAIPCVYAMSYGVLLVSLDRFMVPIYPLSLANLVLVPWVLHGYFKKNARASDSKPKVDRCA